MEIEVISKLWFRKVIPVKNKKLIVLLFVSICVFNRVNGMEFVLDVVKNEVLPAALIMGTGAALGAIHSSLSWQIYEGRSFDWKKMQKKAPKVVHCGLFLL